MSKIDFIFGVDMIQFSIQDIENLTGIKAHTIRMWEKRYNFVSVQRKESQHRYFSDLDLKKLLKVVTLYKNGIKLKTINDYNTDQLNVFIQNLHPFTDKYSFFINQLIEATVDYDEALFNNTLEHAIKDIGFTATIINIAFPLMSRVGALWLSDNLHVIQEHFCSNLVRNRIIAQLNQTPLSYEKCIHYLLFTPQGEQHEIPLLFIHYLLRKNGNKVTYIGKNVSLDAITAVTNALQPDYIWLHTITNLTDKPLDEITANLKKLPTKKIICSGPAFETIDINEPKVSILKSITEILGMCG